MFRLISLFGLAFMLTPVWAGPNLEDLISDADDIFLVQVEKKADCNNAFQVKVLNPFQRPIQSSTIVVRSSMALKPDDKLFLFMHELKGKDCAGYEVMAHSAFPQAGDKVYVDSAIEMPIFIPYTDAGDKHVVPEQEWTRSLKQMMEGC